MTQMIVEATAHYTSLRNREGDSSTSREIPVYRDREHRTQRDGQRITVP